MEGVDNITYRICSESKVERGCDLCGGNKEGGGGKEGVVVGNSLL
jgi:hypothetical protein